MFNCREPNRIWELAIFVAVLWLCPLASADTLVLATGETLAGVVIEDGDGGVVFDHPLLGRLELGPEDVRSVTRGAAAESGVTVESNEIQESDKAEVSEPVAPEVVAQSGTAPAAPTELLDNPLERELSTKDEAANDDVAVNDEKDVASEVSLGVKGKPETKSESDAKPEPEPEVVAEPRGGFFDTGLFADWKSTLSFGLSGFSGASDRIDFYGRFAGKKKSDRGSWNLLAEAFYAETPDGSARDEGKLETTKRWTDPKSAWFVFATGRYQYNRLTVWDDRLSAYAGLGRTFGGEGIEMSAEVGLGGNYEFGTVNDFTPEAVFGASALAWQFTPRQTIKAKTTVYPNLETLGDLRIESDLEWRLKLDAQTDTLLKVGLRHEHESREEGKDRDDLKYFAAVEFSF